MLSFSKWFHWNYDYILGFHHPHTPTGKPYLSSALQFSENGNLVLVAMEVSSCQLSTIVTKGFVLDTGKAPGLAKLVFIWQKKTRNLIQKLFKTETALYGSYEIMFTIAGSTLLLSSKIDLFMIVVKGFQCKAIDTKSSILDITDVPEPPLVTTFGKVIFNKTQATVFSFNLIAIYGRSYLYGIYEIIFCKDPYYC